MYSEFLVECAFFDQRDECWNVLQLLLRHVLRDQGEDAECSWNQDEFTCMAYILCRRCRLFELQEDEIHYEFKQSLSFFALRCGESKYWTNATMDWSERNRILHTLQKVGVLGLMDLTDNEAPGSAREEDTSGRMDTSNSSSNHGHNESSMQCWPFSAPYDIRSAFMRMRREGMVTPKDWALLLSSPTHDEEVALSEKYRKQKKSRQTHVQGPPISDYLGSTDLLCLIFSFCGYKRLVKLRGVCQTWKDTIDTSNSLWHAAYRSRFGFLSQDPRANQQLSKEDWRSLFPPKWLAEQNVRFQRHGTTGWKYKICGYIGCFHVLKSARQETKHYDVHARKEAAEERSRTRTIKKSQAKKKKCSKTNKSTSANVFKKSSNKSG
jgi:hypothetical protein